MIGGHDEQVGTLFALDLVWEITEPHLSVPPATRQWLPFGGSTMAPAARMSNPRVFTNAVLLPDLSVMVVGGSANDFQPFAGPPPANPPEIQPIPVYAPERLDFLSATPAWQVLAPQSSPRLYHSVALLLKDGRVASMGGYTKDINQTLSHSDCEVFTPPYLDHDYARPSIESAPPNIPYGGPGTSITVAIGDMANPANDIDFATLIRPGSLTHHFDWDQRCIKLAVTVLDSHRIRLAPLPPADATNRGHFLAPPGHYMLFVVRKATDSPPIRIPSVARFVHVP